MQGLLQEIIVANVFTFLLLFMRLGIAIMLMPGIGDSFVSPNVRLYFALAFTFVLTPFMTPYLPRMPDSNMAFMLLLIAEGLVGLFIGTIMRLMVSALDTAGSIISIQAGFSNAMVFNPMTASQGSVVGALYSVLGVTLLLATNLHHFLLASAVESYSVFPPNGTVPDTESMLEAVRTAVSGAFLIGVQIALPFLVVGLLVQFGFGVLGRLMPQVQIFFLALPVQIGLSLVMVVMVLSAGMIFWLNNYGAFVSRLLGF